MSPKQKKIAAKAPPPDKIDGKDFAVLKAEKAKGRGMGLQDESVKPGKVMKARTGKMVPLKKDPTKPISSVAPKVTDALKKKKLPGRIGTALGIGSMLVPAAYAAAKQYKDYKSAKNRDKAKVKKYSKGGDLRLDYIDRQTRLNEKATGKKNYIAESKKTRREEYGAAKDRYPNKTDKLRSVAKNVGRALTPSFAAAKSVYDKLSKSSAEKYSVGGGADLGKKGIIKGINANLQDKAERRLNVPDRTDIKKQKTSVTKLKEQARRSRLETMKDRQTGRPVYERMGGGMMQRPMGYVSGGKAKSKPASPERKPEGIKDDTFDPIMKKPEGMKKELAIIQTEDAISRKNIGDGKKMTRRGLMKVVDAAADDRQLGRSLRKFQRDVFKTGGSVMARGCKLGRNKKTKLY